MAKTAYTVKYLDKETKVEHTTTVHMWGSDKQRQAEKAVYNSLRGKGANVKIIPAIIEDK